MDGITILSEKIFYSDLLPSWFIGLSLIGFVISAVFIIVGVTEGKFKIAILSSIIFLFSLTLGIATNTIKSKEIDYIEYKVTIDNSVPMTEFYQRYEILDQEGKIYTVKERE